MWSDGEDSITSIVEVFSHRLEVRIVDRSKRCMMLKIENEGIFGTSVPHSLGHIPYSLRIPHGSRQSFNF